MSSFRERLPQFVAVSIGFLVGAVGVHWLQELQDRQLLEKLGEPPAGPADRDTAVGTPHLCRYVRWFGPLWQQICA